ncbi:MAG: type 1 glutamine amidotransferase [Pseudomonadota bacterium]
MKQDIASLRVAVLQTGRSADGTAVEHGDYDEMCKALILREPSEATTFAVLDGEFPSNVDAYDVYLVTGSAHGVYEDFDWIAPLESLIREIYERQKKLIGICFGHQIIAQALGGRVEKSDRGFGVGVMEYQLTDKSGGQRNVALYAWHQDQVVAAPRGAEVIARSDFCEIAGLRYGDHGLTFQPHPEFTKDYMEALANIRRGGTITDEMSDEAIASLKQKVDADLIQDMLVEFMSH